MSIFKINLPLKGDLFDVINAMEIVAARHIRG